MIFSQCDSHCSHASFALDSFFPVQSILFIDLIPGTIPLKSLLFPSVFSSPSCFRAGQRGKPNNNNHRHKKIKMFTRFQFGAAKCSLPNRHRPGVASFLPQESKHCWLWHILCFIYNSVLETYTSPLMCFFYSATKGNFLWVLIDLSHLEVHHMLWEDQHPIDFLTAGRVWGQWNWYSATFFDVHGTQEPCGRDDEHSPQLINTTTHDGQGSSLKKRPDC